MSMKVVKSMHRSALNHGWTCQAYPPHSYWLGTWAAGRPCLPCPCVGLRFRVATFGEYLVGADVKVATCLDLPTLYGFGTTGSAGVLAILMLLRWIFVHKMGNLTALWLCWRQSSRCAHNSIILKDVTDTQHRQKHNPLAGLIRSVNIISI